MERRVPSPSLPTPSKHIAAKNMTSSTVLTQNDNTVFILLYVKSVLWLNLAPVVQKVNNSIHWLEIHPQHHPAFEQPGPGLQYYFNLVWFRISFLSQPVLIIQMYSVQVTMKFWFTLITDFTYNIFKCWLNLYFDSNKKYNAELLRFRRRKTRLDQSQ